MLVALRSIFDWLLDCPVKSELFLTFFCVNLIFALLLRRHKPLAAPKQRPSSRPPRPHPVTVSASSSCSTVSAPSSSSSSSSSSPAFSPAPCSSSPYDPWSTTALAFSVDLTLLLSLRSAWRSKVRSTYLQTYPGLIHDRYFCWNLKDEMPEACVLCRFLKAMINQNEADPLTSALRRLDSVVQYRCDYRCNDFYTMKNSGSLLFKEASNPGAEMYFADSCLVDRNDQPYIYGCLGLCDGDRLDAANHLRCGMFVIDRIATSLVQRGVVGGGRVPRATYVLDLTEMGADQAGTVSGTGCGGNVKKEFKRKGGVAKRVNPIETDCEETHVGIKPHMPAHYGMESGLPCLKEALRIMTNMYPELLERIYFYNSPFWFYAIFSIFSLWVKKDTREKFVFVKKGDAAKFEDTIPLDQLPRDVGGPGVQMGGKNNDDWIARAIRKYDEETFAPMVTKDEREGAA